ncbi:MAG: serine/threonine-protein kinase, partial [Polyangiaceae bacterium]
MRFDVAAPLDPGRTFNGRYEVVRCINAGGMGAVYEVLHIQTQRARALKVMLPSLVDSESARARFKLEATVVAGIESDHIAEVIDADIDEETGAPFIVMELLIGEELGALVERNGPLPPAEAITYLRHAAYALDKTHAAGIVHRDLKPENLFVTYRDDGSPRVKILDFGIAKVIGDVKTRHTQGIIGTPLFMSPEQIHGEAKICPQTDGYALAHIAYNLLVGEPYWTVEESSVESIMPLLVMIMRGHPDKPSIRAEIRGGVTLPDGFDDWFARAAHLSPSERFDTTLQLVSELAALWQDEAIGRATVTPPMTAPLPIEAPLSSKRSVTADTLASPASEPFTEAPATVPIAEGTQEVATTRSPEASASGGDATAHEAAVSAPTPARSTGVGTSRTVDVAIPTRGPGKLVVLGMAATVAALVATAALVRFGTPAAPEAASSAPVVEGAEDASVAEPESASDEGDVTDEGDASDASPPDPSASSAATAESSSRPTASASSPPLARPPLPPPVPRPTPAP